MKKVIKYMAFGLVALASTSCLDLNPQDQLAESDLWGKPGDFESFANVFYNWIPDFGTVYDNLHADKRSDLVRDKNGVNVFANGTNTVPQGDGDYSGAYSNIRRCNLLIENAAGYGNQAEIAQYLGEAYFFRAWNYFNIMQKFGDVIIVDHTIDVDDALMSAKRNDRSEVCDFIIEDLRKACELMKSTADLPEGRVGVEGAYAFMARVALFEGTWQKFRSNEARGKELCGIAADAANEVIKSGKFELFAPAILGDSAQKYMFILENTQCNPAGLQKDANKEYIIKRCYDATLKVIGRNLNTEIFANAQYVSSKFADMYLCQDGLPIEKSPLFQGYQTIKSEWQNRDNRMRYTLMRPGDSFWTITEKGCRIDWSGSEEELKHAAYNNFTPNWGSGYFPQKWATERQLGKDTEGSYDWPALRYAEVLLTYAEAVYERDDKISDEDLNKSLNLVRQRVNKKMPALTNAFVNANGLDMRQEIRRERTIEFFQEGFRIDDLRRWKTAEVEMPMDFTGIRHVGEWQVR
ncbi:MAG: RagB/SusD family nutrient uptake outer membrane protein, partial [Muribaculaceae bacterium]|nr:RagB/SusD family nutrient uptake outer membrane protein [Muribaculaceae bacterium]